MGSRLGDGIRLTVIGGPEQQAYCCVVGGAEVSEGKMNPGDEFAPARIAVVAPVTLSKTSSVALTLQVKDCVDPTFTTPVISTCAAVVLSSERSRSRKSAWPKPKFATLFCLTNFP